MLMNGHSNRKLFDLATKNSQRRALEHFIREISPELQQFIDSNVKFFHPETPLELKEAISQSGRLHSQSAYTNGAQILETAYFEKAKTLVLNYAQHLSDGEYFVWLGGSGGFTIDGKTQWVPDLPIICASIDSIRSVLGKLLPTSGGELAVTKRGGSEAIILDSYSGILENEPTEKEIVYELSYWKHNG